MAFDPRRRLAVVRAASPQANRTRRFLQRAMPDSWRFAQQMTADLVRQVEFLAWAGRSEALDTYFLRQAEGVLGASRLSELVGGRGQDEPQGGDLDEPARRFAGWCQTLITAVLLELDERVEVANADQALTYLLTSDLRFSKAAAIWTAEHGMAPVHRALRALPGYALVLLAASPNDTAERFMARDAFWTAVMDRT